MKRGKILLLIVPALAVAAFFLFPAKSKIIAYFVGAVGADGDKLEKMGYGYLRARYFAHKGKQVEFTYDGKKYTTLTGTAIPT